jgi:hypothetical protein
MLDPDPACLCPDLVWLFQILLGCVRIKYGWSGSCLAESESSMVGLDPAWLGMGLMYLVLITLDLNLLFPIPVSPHIVLSVSILVGSARSCHNYRRMLWH